MWFHSAGSGELISLEFSQFGGFGGQRTMHSLFLVKTADLW